MKWMLVLALFLLTACSSLRFRYYVNISGTYHIRAGVEWNPYQKERVITSAPK